MQLNLIKNSAIVFSFFIIFSIPISFADSEDLLITFSDKMRFIDFDGKWTFFSEWKESSLTSIGNMMKIRSAHYGDFVYVFVDVLFDSTLDKKLDKATVCFIPRNLDSSLQNNESHCFVGFLDSSKGHTLKNNSTNSSNDFQQIPNHSDLIIVGGTSDENDRYLKSPHPSYEFKIPTDVIQRYSHYGFYVEAYDESTNKKITWPENINNSTIPLSIFWGDMISPDKSLPEFSFPSVILVLILFTMIIMSRKLNYGRLRININ